MNNNGQTPIGEDMYGTPIYLGDTIIITNNGRLGKLKLVRKSSGDKHNYIGTQVKDGIPKNIADIRWFDYSAQKWETRKGWNFTLFNSIISPDRMKYRCIKVSD